jgi:hypothetical protein
MKDNPIYFSIIAFFLSLGFIMFVAAFRKNKRKRLYDDRHAAKGYNPELTERPFISTPCNN